MIELTGTVTYSRFNQIDENENHVLGLKLEADSIETFLASGLQLKLSPENVIYLKRKPEQRWTDREGNEHVVGLPGVFEEDGVTSIDPTKIGKDSIVSCKVAVYDTRKGKGHRLEKIKVHNLVEPQFESNDRY